MTREHRLRAAALAVLRADAMIGAHDDHPATRGAETAHDRIMGVTVADMPADPDMVGVLLETLSQRLGGVSRADCWRHIGVNPNRGRDLLARNANALDWPIFFTLRSAALAPERREAIFADGQTGASLSAGVAIKAAPTA